MADEFDEDVDWVAVVIRHGHDWRWKHIRFRTIQDPDDNFTEADTPIVG